MKRRFEITKEGSHAFDIGTIVEMVEDDGTNMPKMIGIDRFGDYDDYWVRYSEMKEIKPNIFRRIVNGIIGALFGPESHSSERYNVPR